MTGVDGGGGGSPVSGLLEASDLRVRFEDEVDALRGVSVAVGKGESLGIFGETGSGKSTLARCLAGLVQPPEASGSVRLEGAELLGAGQEELRSLRWSRLALAPQNAAFNPVVTVGRQIAEPLVAHGRAGWGEALGRAGEVAGGVGLDVALLERYPHELSGGQRRLALVAMTLVMGPELVVLDEPTAGLDPRTKAALLGRIQVLQQRLGFALIVISHDLSDVARLAERAMVLYAGEVMEEGETGVVLGAASHPYTSALVNAYPVMSTTKDLRPMRGRPPDARAVPSGCPFHPRCTQAEAVCSADRVELVVSGDRLVACHFGGLKTLVSATGLRKSFGHGKNLVQAVDGISVTLRQGESLGVVGPSGSGKSTLAGLLSGHLSPDAGSVMVEGAELSRSVRKEARRVRQSVQLVMQDPWDALSPRMTVEQLVREPLDVVGEVAGVAGAQGGSRRERVLEALDSVGLPTEGGFLEARSDELSGGQLQRVALARALVLHPRVLVADEPTAMLDASEQARVLLTLKERQVEMGLGLIFVSHDMAVVRKVTDRIVVLEEGRIVEEGPSNVVSTRPQSATARELIEASPSLGALDAGLGVGGAGVGDADDDGVLQGQGAK